MTCGGCWKRDISPRKSVYYCLRIAVLLILVVVGCTAKTVITQPDGQEYVVVSQKDAVVHMKMSNSVSLTVDNRGEGGIMSDIIKMWSLKYITEDGE